MARHSDPKNPADLPDALWEKLIGLGERSHRKSYYPELQARLAELERFRAVLDQGNDAIFLLEVPGGRIIDANMSACRQLGLSRKDVLGVSIFRVSGLGGNPVVKELLNSKQMPGRTLDPLVSVLFPSHGESLPVEVTINRHGSGEHEYAAVVARDISERLRAEEILSERTRLAELGAQVGRALTEEDDLSPSLQLCAEAFVRQTDAAFVRIWTLDPSETILEMQASAGMYTHTDGEHGRIDLRNYPYKLGVICREQRPYMTNSVIGDPHFHNQKWARAEGIVAFAGYPLLLQGRLVGVIALFARIALSDIVLKAISSVAYEIAIGIERHRTRDALNVALRRTKEGRDRIDAILRSVADGLIVTDMSGHLVLMNRRAEGLLGISQSLAIGKTITQVMTTRSLRDHLTELISLGGYAALVDLEMPDHNLHEMRTIQARTSQVRTQTGETTALVTTLRDVTREREVDRLKSEFITTAAHELRTPLTSVKGFSELLLSRDDFSAAERREYLTVVYENAGVLEHIVEELLDLSRIEAGRSMTLKKAPCDLSHLLSEVVSVHRRDFPAYHFEVDLPDGEFELMIDATRIQAVLTNLMGNAIKYSTAGSTVRLGCSLKAGECCIVVEDEGMGMSEEQRDHCFDKFYRANNADTALGGLGLGLTIAKAVVEAHGGAIWAESEEGRGTRMFFTLPLTADTTD